MGMSSGAYELNIDCAIIIYDINGDVVIKHNSWQNI